MQWWQAIDHVAFIKYKKKLSNICVKYLFSFFLFFFGLEANSYNPWSKYYLFQKIVWNLAKYHVVFTMQLLEMLFLLTNSYQLGVVVCCPPFVGNQIRVFKRCWVSSMVIKTFQFCKKRKLSSPPPHSCEYEPSV